MNKCCFTFLLFFLFSHVNGQVAGRTIPEVGLKNMMGEQVLSTTIFDSDSSVTIISFWATWCKPCLQELDNLNDVLPDWKKKKKLKLIAISVDDARNTAKLPAFVAGRGWDFEVLSDANSELKRQMNVVNVPHTFLLNRDGRIVHQHTSYAPGDEDALWQHIQNLK